MSETENPRIFFCALWWKESKPRSKEYCFVPISLETDEGGARSVYLWEKAKMAPSPPDGWRCTDVVEAEGDEDLAWGQVRDFKDAHRLKHPIEPFTYEFIEDFSHRQSGDLLERLLGELASYEREHAERIRSVPPDVEEAMLREGMTSLKSYDEFARLYAKWLLKLNKEEDWELFYEDGRSTGSAPASMFIAMLMGFADASEQKFRLHPVQPGVEIELYRYFLERFRGMYGRADATWEAITSRKIPSSVSERIAKAVECYLLDMSTQGAVMCRATLEAVYEEVTDDADVRREGCCDNQGRISMDYREKYLGIKRKLRGRTKRLARDIRRAGNLAAHENEEPDLLRLLQDLVEVLLALLPSEPWEQRDGPAFYAVTNKRYWIRRVESDKDNR